LPYAETMESNSKLPPVKRHRVLIVDDHAAIREMLAVFVTSLSGFEVVGQAGTLEEAAVLAGELRPGVVVLDWMFPGGSGAEFLVQLKTAAPHAQVLVFSATASPYVVHEALTGGAKGFVEKGASIAELTQALRAVAAGGVYFGPASARTVDGLVRTQLDTSAVLTTRERAVLMLLAEGLPSKAIASRLAVSVKTVNNDRVSLTAKTGLHSIALLTMHAVRLGLVPGPGDVVDPGADAGQAVPPEAAACEDAGDAALPGITVSATGR
jgi:DNA-binding NarL/FixJ family response regulator